MKYPTSQRRFHFFFLGKGNCFRYKERLLFDCSKSIQRPALFYFAFQRMPSISLILLLLLSSV